MEATTLSITTLNRQQDAGHAKMTLSVTTDMYRGSKSVNFDRDAHTNYPRSRTNAFTTLSHRGSYIPPSWER